MILVIGGYAQGKLNIVLKKSGAGNEAVSDGRLPDEKQLRESKKQGRAIIINHFHSWVRERMLQDGDPKEEILSFVAENPECIIISDEIGNGIVPIDAFEREYREQTGRILTELAAQADEVVRVICGIGQKIK